MSDHLDIDGWQDNFSCFFRLLGLHHIQNIFCFLLSEIIIITIQLCIFALVFFLIKNKFLLSELPIFEVTDQHAFGPVRYSTFIADVWPSKGVITCDHNYSDLGILQLMNSWFRLRFKLILKHFKPIE